MKPNRPKAINSTRNSITVGWDDCELVFQKMIKNFENCAGEDSEEKKWWYVLEKKDRVLGWCIAYMGFKTQTEIRSLSPGDYYEFRLKVRSDEEESDWSDTLFAVTRDDIIPVAQLHRVVENGPVATLRRILSQRPSSVDVPNKFQQTPLKLAILKNNTTFMGILLSNGAEVDNPEPSSGKIPLMVAAQKGLLEPVQLLLEKGSSWETKDRNGLTAFNYAVDNSRMEIVELAMRSGVDLKGKDRTGWTPLMRAVILNSSLEVLLFLLNNGSDPNEADERKQTVLMQAVLSDRPEVVELLLQKGADITRKNIYGHSAYDMAKSSTNDGILKLLYLLGSECDEEPKNKKKK